MITEYFRKYTDVRCKICGEETSIFGVKDFSCACESQSNPTFSLTGHAIYYHRCKNCGFIFSTDFDSWSKDDFQERIYNDNYVKVDGDYVSKRPIECVRTVDRFLNRDKNHKILDYGAGNDVFSREMKIVDYDACGWDPMWNREKPNERNFDLVTAFEVIEHSPTPVATAQEMISFLKTETGTIMIGTLVNDVIKGEGINYWYLAPRNGHVCMHSNRSIEVLFGMFGMRVTHSSNSQHIVTWK